MERRNFLLGLPAAALTLSYSGSLSQSDANPLALPSVNDPIVEKVKLAMLSLQRATWEQGVAMQAMLELGKSELVILMA